MSAKALAFDTLTHYKIQANSIIRITYITTIAAVGSCSIAVQAMEAGFSSCSGSADVQLVLAGLPLHFISDEEPTDSTFRVVTYNIYPQVDSTQYDLWQRDMLEEIKRLHPEILCLQEFKKDMPWPYD